MVGLPDRADGVVDEAAGGPTLIGVARAEIPDARPKIGSGKHRIGDDADKHDQRHRIGQAHQTPTSSAW